jgi:hypothetical protein
MQILKLVLVPQLCLLWLKEAEAGPANSDALGDLKPWDLSLVSGAGRAVELSTVSAVVSSLINCEPESAVMAGVGMLVLHPVVDKAFSWLCADDPAEETAESSTALPAPDTRLRFQS